MKYIEAECTGKGFITHEDKEVNGLSFTCHPGNIVAVDGEQDKVNAWISRVNGNKKTKKDAQAMIDALNIEGGYKL